MKQYTNEQQTAKLIEFGFEKPKSEVKAEQNGDCTWYNPAYSIGELIELLPSHTGTWTLSISYDYAFERWICDFNPIKHHGNSTELADALFKLLVNLKETGEI